MTPLLLAATAALAQTLPPGDPLRVIETERFELIYPQSAEASAQQAAALLERVAPVENTGFDVDPPKLSVLLHNQYTLPNGYVTLAPRHSAWFTVPFASSLPTVFGTSETWLPALAIHEYRHVTQLQQSLQGATKLAWALGGEYGWLYGVALSQPAWFLEGDAVVTETVLSEGGRGRTPAFTAGLRTLYLERGRPFSYEKMRLGSYRDPIPDHYPYGYLMVAEGRRAFDEELWTRVSGRAARVPIRPFPFHASLRQETGMGAEAFQGLLFTDIGKVWTAQQQARQPFLDVRAIGSAPARPVAGDTLSASPLPDGSVLASRRSTEDSGSLIRVWPDGREETLCKLGVRLSERVSAGGGRVVWDEIRFHPRWAMKTWSILRVLDLETGQVRDLTQRSRLFSPTIAPDGATVAALEYDLAGAASLVLIDVATGAERARFTPPDGQELLSPRYAVDGQTIVVVGRKAGAGTGILRLRPATGQWALVLPHQHDLVSDPAEADGRVVYVSGEAGLEDLWMLDLATGARARLGTRPYGAYSPAFRPDGHGIVFSDVGYWGTALAEIDLAALHPTPAADVSDLSDGFFEPLIAQEDQRPPGGLYAAPVTGTYASKPYRRFLHPINVFAWMPAFEAGSFGAQVFSTDKTLSIGASLKALYVPGERTGRAEASVAFTSLPVEISASGGLGRRAIAVVPADAVSLESSRVSWDEAGGSLALALPLDLTRGAWVRYLNLSATAEALVAGEADYEDPAYGVPEGYYPGGTAFPLSFDASFSRYSLVAARELAPRWSQSVDLSAVVTPLGGDLRGNQLGAGFQLGFPGLARLHHTGVYGHLLRRNGDAERFTRPYLFASGVTPPDLHSEGLVGAVYRFPLIYPDFAAGPFLYVKRVQGAVFGDWGEDLEGGTSYRSVGAELTADMNLFRLGTTLNMGLRGGWLVDEGAPFVEPAVAVGF